MRIHFIAALFMFCTQCFGQGSFTCNYGQRAACLGYSDKVVESSSTCFTQFACGIGGSFVCKSKLDDALDEYNTLVGKYNELLRKYKDLGESTTNLVNSSRALESDLGECTRKYKQGQEEISDAQDQLRRALNEANDLRMENLRLLSENSYLRQAKRKSK